MVQVTALGNPHLLERVSNTLKQMRKLFRSFDTNGDGYVTKAEFSEASCCCPAACEAYSEHLLCAASNVHSGACELLS